MKKILLGNEAIVQGALESGVQYVSAYPGTPSSEIGIVFGKIAQKHGIYFEFAVNEKTAMESAIGSSYSGLKTLVSMKNFGLNVALDAFLPFVYTGAKGATVIVVADDPSCHSSGQSEENSRGFADLAHVPILEPQDAQEAKDFTILAFKLSEKYSVPVILRTTTRVAHQRMPVEIGIINIENKKGEFVKNKNKFVTMPPRVLEMKGELLKKLETMKKDSEKLALISRGKGKLGIITSGVANLHVTEVLRKNNLNIPVLKIGMFNPLPEKKILSFVSDMKEVLIAEELEGFIEKKVKEIAGCKLKIYGKDLLPEIGELSNEKIALALGKLVKKKLFVKRTEKDLKIPLRYPRLCQGCPYWIVFSAIKKMAPEGTIFGGDIGCYMLAGFAPHEIQDYLLRMGSSIGVGHGINKAGGQKVIALIGDSTFFHAGIPALINSVYNKSDLLIFVLDNRITAMTGHQPNPGMGLTGTGESAKEIKIEDIAKACGAENVKTVDPVNMQELQDAIRDFINKKGTSVIVSRRICAYYERKLKKNI